MTELCMDINKKRFELILDYHDEIGIKDNLTDDVIVAKIPQNQNTLGFCSSIVDFMNRVTEDKDRIFNQGLETETINYALRKRLEDKEELLKKQLTVSENLDKELRLREKEINDIKRTLENMIDNERTHLGHNALVQFQEAIQ